MVEEVCGFGKEAEENRYKVTSGRGGVYGCMNGIFGTG